LEEDPLDNLDVRVSDEGGEENDPTFPYEFDDGY
jgi:hypothetical protein